MSEAPNDPAPSLVNSGTPGTDVAATVATPGQTPATEAPVSPAAETKAPESLVSAAQPTFSLSDLKLPENVDKSQVEAYATIATDLKLSPEQGQKLFDYGHKLLADNNASIQKSLNDIQAKWVGEIKSDPKWGGDKLDANLSKISKFLTQYGDADLRSALDLTGAGNNPSVFRLLARLANTFTEGEHVSGTPAAGKPALADIFFPSMKGP